MSLSADVLGDCVASGGKVLKPRWSKWRTQWSGLYLQWNILPNC